jgi:uncharacterized iron-regulated membrane protein
MSLTPRRALFWLHLTAGSIAGIVIFVLSVTGACLAYQRQVIAWADRAQRVAANGRPQQSLQALVASAQTYTHASASSVALHSDPSLPAEVTFGREPARVLLLDPYSAAVLGESAPRMRSFFATITAVHRWFGMQGANRTTARAIKGAFTLAMLFLVCSGTILWLPRKWTRQHVRKSLLFRRNLEGHARDWNWHNVIGIWLAVPLLLISLTGVIMAYPWANDLLYRLSGSPSPPRQPENAARASQLEAGTHRGHHEAVALPEIGAVLAAANQQVPGWRTVTLRLSPDSGPAVLQVDRGDGGRPDLRTQITLGNPPRVESFTSYNTGRQLRMWARFTHTGEAGGIAGETIALIASLGAATLMVTGFSLSLRRLSAWRNRKSEQKQAAAA